MKKIATLLAVLVLIAGCSTIGERFDPNLVNTLQPGVSTVQDAVKLLGAPTSVSNAPDGSKVLQWQFSQGTIVGASAANAMVLFGGDNRMIRVVALTTLGMESAAPTQQAMATSGARPRLGINVTPVSARAAENLKMPATRGIFIAAVVPGGVADRAGLSQGDVILNFNGAEVADNASLLRVVNAVPVGQKVPVLIWRGGREVSITVTF